MEKQTISGLPCRPQAALGAPGWPHTDTVAEATSVCNAAPAQAGLPSFLPSPLLPSLPSSCVSISVTPHQTQRAVKMQLPHQMQPGHSETGPTSQETTGQQAPLFPSAVQTIASY